jgi:peptidoglycan/LPS O-acetylase OafA/YrhL
MSGTFAATSFLALQGILLNTLGEHLFRRIRPLLQGASLMVLLAVLLVFPMVSQSLQPLLSSNAAAVHYFPPFWYIAAAVPADDPDDFPQSLGLRDN